MKDLKSATINKEGYMQEEIVSALARERELWQRERVSQVITVDRERSQHIVEVGLFQGYIGLLISVIRGQGMFRPLTPFIPGKDPPIRRHETDYIPVPSGLIG